MKALQFSISGRWAHFRKPETNRTPLTHDFITKTALIGLMGAVLGIDRRTMRPLFPVLSEDLLYGVRLLKPVKKESHGFVVRRAKYPARTHVSGERKLGRKRYEFLKNPHFQVAVALRDKRSEAHFDKFLRLVRCGRAYFPPVLGWHNCPANLELVSVGTFDGPQTGTFEANCFVSGDHNVSKHTDAAFHVGIDRMPTYQEDFWNHPDQYQTVVYPFGDHALEVEGEYYEYDNGDRWWLM